MRNGLVIGVNVDAIDVAAGLRELVACGYPASETERHFVIEHALMRWARGEEEAAQRGAIDKHFHGIDLTSWIRVLAAGRAACQSEGAQVIPAPAEVSKGDLIAANEKLASDLEISNKALDMWMDRAQENSADLQRMRASFHVNMLRAFPSLSHEQIAAEIDKCVGVKTDAPTPVNITPVPTEVRAIPAFNPIGGEMRAYKQLQAEASAKAQSLKQHDGQK